MVHAAARFAGSIVFVIDSSWGWRPRLYAAARFAGSGLGPVLHARFGVFL